MTDGIVALGGGHGLYATLSAARRLTPYVTAVVTVADDGGSSGRLRSELDVVPPGDLRMALAALASDSPHGRLWATILQHRFGGSGALAGHPIGNLMLAGLSEVLADPVAALDELGRILGVKGRVLPMCPVALQIEADVSGLEADPRMFRLIRGQVAIATTPGKVRRVVTVNLAIAATFIAVLVLWDLFGQLPLPLGVVGHEGSTVLVALNGMRLLTNRSWRAAASAAR